MRAECGLEVEDLQVGEWARGDAVTEDGFVGVAGVAGAAETGGGVPDGGRGDVFPVEGPVPVSVVVSLGLSFWEGDGDGWVEHTLRGLCSRMCFLVFVRRCG